MDTLNAARMQNLTASENRAADLKIAMAQLQANREREANNNQIQLQQLASQDRRYEREDRRADRRSEREMYMALVQGLSNLRF